MNLVIFKFIGLGAIGIAGVGTAIIFGSDKVGKFFGSSSSEVSLSESDKQYQLMYEISKKLFGAINKFSISSAHGKDNVIKWLKDQFSSSLSDETDKWENFKSLCESQKKNETQEGKNVNNEYSRLCYLDAGDDVEKIKGYLWHWYDKDDPKISPTNQIDFLDFSKKNIDLWNEFNSKYPIFSPIDKFDEWYDQSEIGNISIGGITATTGISLFKAVVSKISSKPAIVPAF